MFVYFSVNARVNFRFVVVFCCVLFYANGSSDSLNVVFVFYETAFLEI